MDIRTREEERSKSSRDKDCEVPESPSALDPFRLLYRDDYHWEQRADQLERSATGPTTQSQNASTASANEIRRSGQWPKNGSKDWGRLRATFGAAVNLAGGRTNPIGRENLYITPVPRDITGKPERLLPSALPYETSQIRLSQSPNNRFHHSSSLAPYDNFNGYPGGNSGPVLPKADFSAYNRPANFPSTIPDSDASYQELTPEHQTSRVHSSRPGLPAHSYMRSSEADMGELKSSSPLLLTPRPRQISRSTIPNSSPTSPKSVFHDYRPMNNIVNPLQEPGVSLDMPAQVTGYVIQRTSEKQRVRVSAREKIMDTGSGNQILQRHYNNGLPRNSDMSTQTHKPESELEYDTPEDYYRAMLLALPRKKDVALVRPNKKPVKLSSPREYGTTLDRLGAGTEDSNYLLSPSSRDTHRPFDHKGKRRKVALGSKNLTMIRDLNLKVSYRTSEKQHQSESFNLHRSGHDSSGHSSAEIQPQQDGVISPGERETVRRIRNDRSPSQPGGEDANLGNNPMLSSTLSSDSDFGVKTTTRFNFSASSKVNTSAPSNTSISAIPNFPRPRQLPQPVSKPVSVRSANGGKMNSKKIAKPAPSQATNSRQKTRVESDEEYVPKGCKKDVIAPVKKEESQDPFHPSSKHNNTNIIPQGDGIEELEKAVEHEDTSENEERIPGQPLDIDYIPRQFWAELGLDPATSEGYQDPTNSTQPQSSKGKQPAVSPLEKFNEDLRSREAAGSSAPIKQLASPFARNPSLPPNPFAALTKPTLPATNSNPLLAAYEYTLNNPVSRRTLADDDPFFSSMKTPIKREPVYGKVDVGRDGKVIKKEEKEATGETKKLLMQTAVGGGTQHPTGTKSKGKERVDVNMEGVTSAPSIGSNAPRASDVNSKDKDEGPKTAENTSGKPLTSKRIKKNDGKSAVGGAENGSGKKKAGAYHGDHGGGAGAGSDVAMSGAAA